jgi:hypothetical protein
MKRLLLRRRIERHRKAAEEARAKGNHYAYCQERRKFLHAQAEWYRETRGK